MAPAKSNATKATIAPVAKKAAKKEAPKATKKTATSEAPQKKVIRVSQRKAYTRPQFRRPHSYRRPKANKPDSNTKVVKSNWDEFRVIRNPLVTDMTMKKIEENNTLTFLVDSKSTKTQIKRAVYALYKVKTVKVNTLIRPDGAKKAYVRLAAAHDAMEVATKIGVM